MVLVGYEEEKELRAWKIVLANSNVPEKESIEVKNKKKMKKKIVK